jgi:hypothetical protein
MYKNKPVYLAIFILLIGVAIYFLVFKKSDFGATADNARTFITSLARGDTAYKTVPTDASGARGGTGKAPAATKWEDSFLPSFGNQTLYNDFLFCDPGWYQPTTAATIISPDTKVITATADRYTGVDANNILGAKKSGSANAGSISETSILTPVIGWAASTYNDPSTTAKYYWSSTCLSAIPNSYIYTTQSSAALTTPLVVTDQYPARICPTPGGSTSGVSSTGPSGSCGEYGTFNAYFQCDYYASAFMNNDTQFWPFITETTTAPSGTVTTAIGITGINELKGVKTYAPSVKTFGTFDKSSTISYSEAMGIPADAVFNAEIDIPGGYGRTDGEQRATMHSINNISGINLSNSQRIRRNVLVGVLVAMHSLMEENINSNQDGPFKGYKTGILLDLKYYYNQYQFSGVAPAVSPKSDLASYLEKTQTYTPGQTYSPINSNSTFGKAGIRVNYTQGSYTPQAGVAAPVYFTSGGTNNPNTTAPKNNELNTKTTAGAYNVNPSYPTPGIFISSNTRHAIYLTLMARDNWIKNQLFYVNYL